MVSVYHYLSSSLHNISTTLDKLSLKYHHTTSNCFNSLQEKRLLWIQCAKYLREKEIDENTYSSYHWRKTWNEKIYIVFLAARYIEKRNIAELRMNEMFAILDIISTCCVFLISFNNMLFDFLCGVFLSLWMSIFTSLWGSNI